MVTQSSHRGSRWSRFFKAGSSAAEDACLVHMTVDTAAVTSLRRLVMRVCGGDFAFMRIALCAGGARTDVQLCVDSACVANLHHAIARQLPLACPCLIEQRSVPH